MITINIKNTAVSINNQDPSAISGGHKFLYKTEIRVNVAQYASKNLYIEYSECPF